MAEKLETTPAQLRFRILFSRGNVAFSNISKITLVCKISLPYVPKGAVFNHLLAIFRQLGTSACVIVRATRFCSCVTARWWHNNEKGWCRTVRNVGKFLQVFMLQVESFSKQQLPALWGQNLNTSKNWSDIECKQLNRTTTEVPCRRQPSVLEGREKKTCLCIHHLFTNKWGSWRNEEAVEGGWLCASEMWGSPGGFVCVRK